MPTRLVAGPLILKHMHDLSDIVWRNTGNDKTAVWQMRANPRTRLAEMESHRLEDMVITSSEAQREAAKLFWRA